MKYYENLLNLGSFNHDDIVKLTGSKESAKKILMNYTKKGYIEKIRRDYYVTISMETHQPVLNRYQLITQLYDSCLTHHSAFEVYGYANQIFYNVYFTSEKRVKNFEYDGVFYIQTPMNQKSLITRDNGLRLTGIEQTVIDSIKDYEKIAGLEEVLRCIELIPVLDEKKLLNCLEAYDNNYLYQKCGYILENLGKSIGITDYFLNECLKHIGKNRKYLLKNRNDLILNKKWLLYVPPRFSMLLEKGVFNNDI